MTTYLISGGTQTQPATFSANYATLSLSSGDLLVTGGYDTLISGVSNVGIVLDNNGNAMVLSGNNDSINAGGVAGGYGDTLLETGNNNSIIDAAFGQGGITLAGSYNTLSSNQRQESAAVLISGNNNNFNNAYLVANLTVSGSYNVVNVGGGSVTVSGNNDTITVLDATTIVSTGNNDVIIDDYLRGQPTPQNFATSASNATAQVSVGGSGSSVTLETNNVAVTASGANTSVNAAGDLTTVNASGSGAVIAASAVLGAISISGANTTLTTTLSPETPTIAGSGSIAGAVTVTSVSFSGNASVGTVYNDGASRASSASGASGANTVAPSVPVILTLTAGKTEIDTRLYSSVTDTVGGNILTVGGASVLNDVGGNDTINVVDNTYLLNASLSGANGANTVNFGVGDLYNGSSTSFVSSHNVLNLTQNDEIVVYAANQDTVNINGAGNVAILEANSALTDVAAQANAVAGVSVVNVNGASTALIETSGNSISGANGALLMVTQGDNTITGQNTTALISGAGNMVELTGSNTVISANPYSYLPGPSHLTVQNQFTVQSGQFALGGLDALDQVSGTAAISLFGGNKVTLGGSNDSVTVNDQIYGGNQITNTGAANVITVANTDDAATTITASASTLVNVTDNAGSVIGGPNTNSREHLTFIAGTGTSNTVFGANSNAAITLFGGQSAGNVAYGGAQGGNSLNGGAGGADYFAGGGNGDVLIGGAAGHNTLVAGAGNETLVGAGLGNDAISITGGGGADMLHNFTGSLTVNSALGIATQADIGGSLVVTLSDATRITFAGVASLTQTGNVFSLV